jgi:hypothetical protein
MPVPSVSGDSQVLDTAFALVFRNSRSPDPVEIRDDGALLALIRALVPPASSAECLSAIARVRGLCDAIYDVCESFRAGGFGTGMGASQSVIAELSRSCPGFSACQYEEAFAAGLRWTAF